MEGFSYISDTELAFSKWSSHSVSIATIMQNTKSVFQVEFDSHLCHNNVLE